MERSYLSMRHILLADDGTTIKAILGWDGARAAPRSLGNESLPRWLVPVLGTAVLLLGGVVLVLLLWAVPVRSDADKVYAARVEAVKTTLSVVILAGGAVAL